MMFRPKFTFPLIVLLFALAMSLIACGSESGSTTLPEATATSEITATTLAKATPSEVPATATAKATPTEVPPTASATATTAPSATAGATNEPTEVNDSLPSEEPTEANDTLPSEEPVEPISDSDALDEASDNADGALSIEDLPFPDDAQNKRYDASSQEVTYTSPTSVEGIVEFYRQALPRWQEDEAYSQVGEQDATLVFEQANAELYFSIYDYEFGSDEDTNVTIRTTGFSWEMVPANDPLEVELRGNLIIPSDTSAIYHDGSDGPEGSLTAISDSDFATVLEFYRRELPALGWQEYTDTAIVTTIPENHYASLIFSKDGVSLNLELINQGGDDTDISITTNTIGGERASIDVNEFPVPDDARDIKVQEHTLSYLVFSDIDSFRDFYTEELGQLGLRMSGMTGFHNIYAFQITKFFTDDDGYLLRLTYIQQIVSTEEETNPTGEISVQIEVLSDTSETVQEMPEEDDEFGASQTHDYPLPSDNLGIFTEATEFRKSLVSSSPSDISTLLEFYRTELPPLGWQEDTDAAIVDDTQAFLMFDGPESILTIELSPSTTDDNAITITEKFPAKAEEAGLLPPPGQARVVLANDSDMEVTFTINGEEFKVGPGVNSDRKLDGPVLDLAPSTLTISVTLASGETISEEVTLGADDTWLIGVIFDILWPVQLY